MKKLALIASAMIAVSVPIGSDAQTTSGSPPQLPASSASNSPITSLKAERDAMRQRYRQSRADFIATRDTWRAKSAELKSAKQANNTAISTSLKTELVTSDPAICKRFPTSEPLVSSGEISLSASRLLRRILDCPFDVG